MSGFTNNIRTIMQLDDKDWKKSLDSITKAEKEHSSNFKQLQREQAEALQAKSKILIDQNNKVSSLENEIINKINERIKVRQNEANLDEKSRKESIALINKEIALLRDKKNIEREIAKGYKVDYSSTEKGFKSLIDFNQNYTNILKTAQEEIKNIGEISTQTIEKQIAEEKKYQKAKYDTVSSLLSQKRAEEALENKQKQESIEKQITEEKKYQKAKYETITSLLAQKRAEEQLKSTQKEQFTRDYINAPAQNKYNDAVSKLNDLETRGIITSKEKEKAIAKEKIALDTIEKSTSNLANTTIRYLRWAGTIAGVFYAGQRAWDMTLGKGIEVNKMIEDNTTGIAALLGANTSMILSNGKVVNSYEKFQMGLTKSKEIMDNIRVAAKSTYATFPQLTEIYQQAIGQTLSFGTSFGKTVDDISNNTVKLAQRMSNIGGAIGQPMDRVKEEIRSMVSANVSTDSIISTMIFGSPSQANEAIKKAKESGTNGLKDMLDSYLKAFDVLEGVKTYTKAQLDLQDAISQTQGQLAEPTFNALKDVFSDLALQVNKMKDDKTFVKWGEDIVSTAKTIIEYADDVLVAFLGWKILPLIFDTVKIAIASLSEVSLVAGSSISNFSKNATLATAKTEALALAGTRVGIALKGLTASLAPLAAVMIAYEGYNWLIGDNIKKEEQLKGIMSKKIDDLNKISSSQLIYNKALLDEQLLVKTKEVQDSKAKVANKGIFGKSELEQKADSAALSVAQEELTNLIKVRKETSDVLTTRENILKKSQEINAAQKELGDLTVKMGRNAKVEEDVKTFIKKEEEEIVKLAKQKKEYADNLVKAEKDLGEVKSKYSDKNIIKFEDIDEVKKQQEYIKNLKEGISKTDKAISEERDKAAKKQITDNEAITSEAKKINEELAKRKSVELEISALSAGTYDTETYKTNMAKLRVETLIEEYKLLQDGDTKQEKLRDLLSSQLEYQKAITIEKEKQDEADRKALQFSSMNKYMDWSGLDMESLNQLEEGLKQTFEGNTLALAELQKQIDKTKKAIYKEPLTLEIKFDGFDEVSNGIAQIGNSFQDMQKEAAKYNQILKDKDADPIKLKQAQLNYADATITGYGDMIGALGSFYDADDERREKQQKLANLFYMAKMAMQVSEMAQSTAFTSLFVAQETIKGQAAASTAVATAAQSSPWTGFATAAAMIALMASLGIMLGGKTKTSTTSDAFSAQKENTGTGTVLGDSEKQSESITNALSILENFAEPQYETLRLMNKHLENISSNIAGFSSLLIRQGGFAFGQGATEFDSGYKNNLDWGDSSKGGALLLQPINSLISKIPIVGQINNMFGNIMGSVMGGLFGKTKVSQALKDSGITFADTLLSSAIEEFNGQAYQTIATTTSKKTWFGSSSSTAISSYFENLDAETNRQFSLVMKNLYDTTILSGDALDTASGQIEQSLANFVVKVGKISLKDKTGDEIQQQIEAIFGQIGDDIAKTAFPLLAPFQKVGEGMFTTLTRVATGMEEAEYYIQRLGQAFTDLSYTEILNKQGDIGFEALLQSIIKTDEAVNGLDNNLVKIIVSLDSTAEELYGAYTTLDKIRDTLRFLNVEAEALSFSSIRGAGSLENLANGIQSYTENFLTESQQLSLSTSLMQKEFNKMNIAMPAGKDGFIALINGIDKTTESGQELYGRVIALSESFATMADSVEQSIKTLEESLKDKSQTMFDDFISSISNMFDSIVGMAESTEATILGIKTGDAGNTQETIYNKFVEYNKLLAKFEAAQISGDTKTAESSYSSLLGMSSDLSQAGYQTEIVGLLESKLAGFNTSKDVLRVNIVDGLGSLINLTEEQTNQLQLAVKDGAVTNSELSSISGLTESQTTSIKEFANNSNYFSTEDTLSNLEEYAKTQLDILKKSQEAETEALSSKSFVTNDYIGTQEKIDISKLLGVSYDTAEPLIKNLQGLDNLNAEQAKSQIASLVGYKTGATSYDTSVASQIEKLSSYLGTNASSALTSISSEASANLVAQKEAERLAKIKAEFEVAKAQWQTNFANTTALFNQEKNAYLAQMAPARGHWSIIEPDWSQGKSMWTYRGSIENGHYNPESHWQPSLTAYNQIQSLLNEKAIKGYAVGSPYIEYDQLAQIHKGEAIIPKTFNEGLQQGDLMMGSTNSFTRELSNIKTVLLDQSRYFNGIITELKNQVRLLTDSKDIQNASLVVLEAIEEVA